MLDNHKKIQSIVAICFNFVVWHLQEVFELDPGRTVGLFQALCGRGKHQEAAGPSRESQLHNS